MALSFKPATADDAAALAELVNAAYRPGPESTSWTHESHLLSGARTSAAQIQSLLRESHILVGFIDARLVSSVQIERHGREAYIGLLAVAPADQAAGIGAATLAEAEAYAARLAGVERFALLVVSARTELVAFYRRRGYTDSGERRDYPINSGVGTPRGAILDLTVLHKPARPAACGARNQR